MLTRQKVLLFLLANSNGSSSRTRLIKLAFLLFKQGKSDWLQTFYEFVPYLYGPFSFTLAHELDCMLRNGMLRFNERDRIELTDDGYRLANQLHEPQLSKDLDALKTEYGALNQNSFIESIYQNFPWFTVNSTKVDKQKTKKQHAQCANYTIGYQAYQVDGLLNILLKQGIKCLVDTRINPISRRYGFHKSTLLSLCQKVGISYIHKPEFGIPSAWRKELETEEDYKKLFERYELEILDRRNSALAQLASEIANEPSALLCQESDHKHCHRSRLALRLSRLNKLPVCELNETARTI